MSLSEDYYPVTKRYVHTVGESWYVIVYDPYSNFYPYHWLWHEDTEPEDDISTPSYATIADALEAAAADWEEAGSGSGGRMATRLKLAATQYRKAGNTRTTRYYGRG